MNKGFTLIELLVAISIVGLLMSVAAVSYNVVNLRSRNTKRITDLEQVRNALELYKSDISTNTYPTASGTFASGSINALVSGYISVAPSDPKSGQSYFYVSAAATPRAYYLCATMEGTGYATGTCTASTACGAAYTYCVQQP